MHFSTKFRQPKENFSRKSVSQVRLFNTLRTTNQQINKPTNMFTSITNTNDNEFNNDDFIYESMIDNGHTHEEASSILYNLYYYGSPYSPDEIDSIRARLNEPIGEDVMKIASEMAKTRAANSSEESNF